ncbi:MAG: hypothetical protein QM605_13465 [Sphingobium sp.]
MIDLPAWPGPQSAVPRVLDFGGFLEPSSGAEVQRFNRLGNRYAIAVTMPPLRNRRDGRIWVNRLIKGQKEGARMEWPLQDFDPGTPNLANGTTIQVDGAGQSGQLLAIRNVAPRYAFLEGQPLSLEIDGQMFFDFVGETAIAGDDGKVTITLTQLLRKEPPDGAVLHVAKPMVEGFIMGDQVAWELALERTVGLSFEIHETR